VLSHLLGVDANRAAIASDLLVRGCSQEFIPPIEFFKQLQIIERMSNPLFPSLQFRVTISAVFMGGLA
jgi:hypothetical protein